MEGVSAGILSRKEGISWVLRKPCMEWQVNLFDFPGLVSSPRSTSQAEPSRHLLVAQICHQRTETKLEYQISLVQFFNADISIQVLFQNPILHPIPSHPISKPPSPTPPNKTKKGIPKRHAKFHPNPPPPTPPHTPPSKTAKHHPPAPLPSPNRLFNQHTYLPCENPHPAPTHPPVPAQ